jgi:uncharacterized membrane protein YhhN
VNTRSSVSEGGRPGDGPWWRFVPRSSVAGYVAVLVAFLLLVQALSKLFDAGAHPVPVLAVEAVLAVVAVAWMVQSVDGLRIRRRLGGRPADRSSDGE